MTFIQKKLIIDNKKLVSPIKKEVFSYPLKKTKEKAAPFLSVLFFPSKGVFIDEAGESNCCI